MADSIRLLLILVDDMLLVVEVTQVELCPVAFFATWDVSVVASFVAMLRVQISHLVKPHLVLVLKWLVCLAFQVEVVEDLLLVGFEGP